MSRWGIGLWDRALQGKFATLRTCMRSSPADSSPSVSLPRLDGLQAAPIPQFRTVERIPSADEVPMVFIRVAMTSLRWLFDSRRIPGGQLSAREGAPLELLCSGEWPGMKAARKQSTHASRDGWQFDGCDALSLKCPKDCIWHEIQDVQVDHTRPSMSSPAG